MMSRAHWHALWITATALLAVDVGLAVLKKFNITLPGLG